MIITKVLILICAQLLKEILHMLPKLGQLKTTMTPTGYQIELNVIQEQAIGKREDIMIPM
jgi:3-deoxy-D-manno-octulosonic-acid transferase